MENTAEQQELRSNLFINSISVIIPLTVAVLLAFPNKLDLGAWTSSLPHIIGGINTLTTLVLIAGFVFIKQNKVHLHRTTMILAFLLGGLFLICYVAYHLTHQANKFNGEGIIRYVYLSILISHILLSLIVLPLVLRALFFALTKQFVRHKKIVKYAYPIWLYVSTTGVIVYLLLYQLFPAK